MASTDRICSRKADEYYDNFIDGSVSMFKFVVLS